MNAIKQVAKSYLTGILFACIIGILGLTSCESVEVAPKSSEEPSQPTKFSADTPPGGKPLAGG